MRDFASFSRMITIGETVIASTAASHGSIRRVLSQLLSSLRATWNLTKGTAIQFAILRRKRSSHAEWARSGVSSAVAVLFEIERRERERERDGIVSRNAFCVLKHYPSRSTRLRLVVVAIAIGGMTSLSAETYVYIPYLGGTRVAI